MKRKCLSVLLLLFFVGLFSVRGPLPAESAGPRRIEVVVTGSFGGINAPTGSSFVILYWEEPGNTAANSTHRVFEAQVAATGVTWSDRGQGVRVTSGGPDRQEYIGYYRYPATISAAAAVTNHRNYIYRVGATANFNEARVYPPLESAHTNYQKHTDTCAGCHRTHRAVHPMLLNRRIMRELCLECHDGRGSKYDVLAGRVNIGSGGWVDSPGGPFWRVDGSGNQLSTSYHNVFLEQAYAWRTGDPAFRHLYAPGGGGGDRYNLTCTDCHSAHVTEGSSPFRLLKFKTPAAPVTAFPFVDNGRYRVLYVDGMNSFCSNCHEQYNYGASTALGYRPHVIDDVYGIRRSGEYYRHPTNINISGWATSQVMANLTLPLEVRGSERYMTCKTCHFAHGSVVRGPQPSYEMAALNEPKYDRVGNVIYLGITSKLKRSDGMGICLECHLDQVWGNNQLPP